MRPSRLTILRLIRRNTINSGFKLPKDQHLFFIFQPLLGHCFFFVRSSNEKRLTTDLLEKDVCFGNFEVENGNVLKGLEYFLSNITLPCLRASSVRQSINHNKSSYMLIKKRNSTLRSISFKVILNGYELEQ